MDAPHLFRGLPGAQMGSQPGFIFLTDLGAALLQVCDTHLPVSIAGVAGGWKQAPPPPPAYLRWYGCCSNMEPFLWGVSWPSIRKDLVCLVFAEGLQSVPWENREWCEFLC